MSWVELEPVLSGLLMLGGSAAYVWARITRRLPRRLRPLVLLVGLAHFATIQILAAVGEQDLAAALASTSELTAIATAALAGPLIEFMVDDERRRSARRSTMDDLDPDAAKMYSDAIAAGIDEPRAMQLAMQYDRALRRVRSEPAYLDPATDPVPPAEGGR